MPLPRNATYPRSRWFILGAHFLENANLCGSALTLQRGGCFRNEKELLAQGEDFVLPRPQFGRQSFGLEKSRVEKDPRSVTDPMCLAEGFEQMSAISVKIVVLAETGEKAWMAISATLMGGPVCQGQDSNDHADEGRRNDEPEEKFARIRLIAVCHGKDQVGIRKERIAWCRGEMERH